MSVIQRNVGVLAVLKDTVSIGGSKEARGQAMVTCVVRLLEKKHLKISDIDLFEINESFSIQAIYTVNQLNMEERMVNVSRGNLALGYPIGATGLRMSIALIYEMIRRGVRWRISIMCAGGNMANATLFENPFINGK